MYWHINNARGELREAYAPGDGRLKLKPGEAASFGDPTELAPLRVSVFYNASPQTILRCYGRDGDDLLVSGAIDGFEDVALEQGCAAWNTPTAGDFADLQAAIAAIGESLLWQSVVDADGRNWMGVAPAYFVESEGGEIQTVDGAHGLPVSLVGAVTLASGSTVAITQGGALNVGVSGSVVVAQTTAANLNATVRQGGDWQVGLAAGANLVGRVSAGVDGSTVYNGETALTPLFAAIDASASGDNEIVAGVEGKKIRVLRWGLSASDEVEATWRSGSTDIAGPRTLPKYAAVGGAYCPVGVFETAAGESLNLNLSAAVAVGGELTYVLI